MFEYVKGHGLFLMDQELYIVQKTCEIFSTADLDFYHIKLLRISSGQ